MLSVITIFDGLFSVEELNDFLSQYSDMHTEMELVIICFPTETQTEIDIIKCVEDYPDTTVHFSW